MLFPTKLLVGFKEGYCNLKCPMCFVHGSQDDALLASLKGSMSKEDAYNLFKQIAGKAVTISPNMWSEPLLLNEFEEYMNELEAAGAKISINTNGLLLDEKKAKFLTSCKAITSIFVSIDAYTSETLKKIRGVSEIEKIKESVLLLLKYRGDNKMPRVGVSFVEDAINISEKDTFVEFWIKIVDAVRINTKYEKGSSLSDDKKLPPRVPCTALFDTMVINRNGNVPICCLDESYSTDMGNIFKEGIESVWNGKKFQEVRRMHTEGNFESIPLCKDCAAWASFLPMSEKLVDGILIRQNHIVTYFNRVDKLSNSSFAKKQ